MASSPWQQYVQQQQKAPAPTQQKSQPTQGYTPDGNPKAPGYNNPDNPWDTGYTGRRNPEKAGGGKNTLQAWDYDKGAPKGSLGLDSNGYYIIPGNGGGGGGGSVIPGAGTYLQDQAGAEKAYQDAIAHLKATRSSEQHLTGMNENWQVDPLSTVGQYQQMLGSEGSALDANIANNQSHGFFGSGLGNQGERALRFDQSAQNFGFQNQLGQYESQYQQGLTDAAAQRQAAMLAALQAAQAAAYGNWNDYGGGDPGSSDQQQTSGGDFLQNFFNQNPPGQPAKAISSGNWAGTNMFGAKPAPKPVGYGYGQPGFARRAATPVPKPAPKPVPRNTFSTRF